MSFGLSEDEIPDEQPWRDKDFLSYCYNELGLSPRAIAYALGVSKSHVTVFLERHGIVRPWRHEPTLRRLFEDKGLTAEEIAALEEFDCSPVTVERYLAKYELSDDDPDDVSYGRLDELNTV
ncbi:hypothetical protein [Haloplanus salilacus]|uniref:hypothetical protein n=1 Tax=Haloplanus salilacus TaxID=2949994 RepID=UPI0030CEBF60